MGCPSRSGRVRSRTPASIRPSISPTCRSPSATSRSCPTPTRATACPSVACCSRTTPSCPTPSAWTSAAASPSSPPGWWTSRGNSRLFSTASRLASLSATARGRSTRSASSLPSTGRRSSPRSRTSAASPRRHSMPSPRQRPNWAPSEVATTSSRSSRTSTARSSSCSTPDRGRWARRSATTGTRSLST